MPELVRHQQSSVARLMMKHVHWQLVAHTADIRTLQCAAEMHCQLSACRSSPATARTAESPLHPARAAKTHRELFSEWYEDLMGEPLAAAMAANPQPAASKMLFDQMMRDITGGGGCADPMGQVSGLSLLQDPRTAVLPT